MISFSCQLNRKDFTLDAAFSMGSGVTALIGPSGSGKTTIIRMIAGLEVPDAGRICFGDTVLNDAAGAVFLPVHKRQIGLVFQDGALLPHLTVRANLAFGRWFTHKSRRRIAPDVVIEVLGIGHLLHRMPGTLSGGERQRVAIGRALLASPRLLLMDEPLASLDDARKGEILPFIERMRDEFAIPILYVSHAMDEVARLANQVIRLEAGCVTASGTPTEVLSPGALARQSDRFDAVSILGAELREHLPEYGVSVLDHPAGTLIVPLLAGETGTRFRIAIPANSVTIAIGRISQVSVRTMLSGRITRIESDNGPFALLSIALAGGDMLKAYLTRLAVDTLALDVGDDVQALIKSTTIDERAISREREGYSP